MKTTLVFALILASCASRADAQALHAQDEASKLERQKALLSKLNDELRNHSNLHDTYLEIASVGDEESVPLLLERLRKDFGDKEYDPPSGFGRAFDCAQGHLIDALRDITNTDQGMYYPRWEAWWQANRNLSQHQWILNGFAADGLHPVEPIDQRFGIELVQTLGRRDDYRWFNAWRMLAKASTEQRLDWASRLVSSNHRSDRLGAMMVLRQINVRQSEDSFRAMTADPDLDIRRRALSFLNEQLRPSRGADPSSVRTLHSADKKNGVGKACFFDGLLVSAFYEEIQAVDASTLKRRWKRKLFRGVGNQMLSMGDHLIVASQAGDLAALDRKGHVLWRSNGTGNDENQIYRLVAYGDELLVARPSGVEGIDPRTGSSKSKIAAHNFLKDADAAVPYAFFIDGRGLHSIQTGTPSAYRTPYALGLSVSKQSVCMVFSGTVTCLEPSTLAQRWTHTVGSDGTWGHSVAPIQYEGLVLVPTDQDLTAFALSDGSLKWTEWGSQGSQGRMALTDWGLLIENTNDYTLELRNPLNGEVTRVWPQVKGVEGLAIYEHWAAVTGLNGELWLVDLNGNTASN